MLLPSSSQFAIGEMAMKLSPEILGLALLTILTVALVKGPLLTRWEEWQALQEQVENLRSAPSPLHLQAEAKILAARIAQAERRLEEWKPASPNRPIALVHLLQEHAELQGCTVLQWSELTSQLWLAEIQGSALGLTQMLHDVELAIPALDLRAMEFHHAGGQTQLKLHIHFPEEPDASVAIPAGGRDEH